MDKYCKDLCGVGGPDPFARMSTHTRITRHTLKWTVLLQAQDCQQATTRETLHDTWRDGVHQPDTLDRIEKVIQLVKAPSLF
jgi:hypothetical protein